MSRSMDTAPRDGTAFLGFSAKYGWWGTCRFDHPDDEMPEIGNPQWEFMQPVHLDGWLPLPSGDVAHTESFYAMEPRSSYNKRPGIDDRDDDPVETAIEELRRVLPSGDGWTRVEDGEPPWGGPPVFAVVQFGLNGHRKIVVGLWGDLQAWTLTGWRFTHWQLVRLPALPEDGA